MCSIHPTVLLVIAVSRRRADPRSHLPSWERAAESLRRSALHRLHLPSVTPRLDRGVHELFIPTVRVEGFRAGFVKRIRLTKPRNDGWRVHLSIRSSRTAVRRSRISRRFPEVPGLAVGSPGMNEGAFPPPRGGGARRAEGARRPTMIRG